MNNRGNTLDPYAPVRGMRHEGRTLSRLEMAFHSCNEKDLRQWQAQGVIEDAVSGRMHPRRRYGFRLMSLLLDGVQKGGVAPERALPWIAALLDIGIKAEPAAWSQWLCQSVEQPWAGLLVEKGANPYGSGNLQIPLITLGRVLYSQQCQARLGDGETKEKATQNERQFMQWMEHASAPRERFHLLTECAHFALEHAAAGHAQETEFWQSVRNHLLSNGVNLAPEHFGPWEALWRVKEELGTIEKEQIAREEKEFFEEQGRYLPPSRRFPLIDTLKHQRKDNLTHAVQEWVEAFLPHLPAEPQARIAGAGFWGALLDHSYGGEVAALLIEKGMKGPWAQPFPTWRENTFLSARYERFPKRLEQWQRHVKFPGPLEWCEQEAWAYVKCAQAKSQHVDVFTSEELANVLDLAHYEKGQALPAEVIRRLGQLPEQWKSHRVAEDEQSAMFSLMRDRGVLDTIVLRAGISPADTAWEAHDAPERAQREARTFFLHYWLKSEHAHRFETTPHLTHTLLTWKAVLAVESQNRSFEGSVAQAVKVNGAIVPVLAHYALNMPVKHPKDLLAFVQIFKELKEGDGHLDIKSQAQLAGRAVRLVAENGEKLEATSTWLVNALVEAGCDLNINEGHLLNLLVRYEKFRKGWEVEYPHSVEMAQALIDYGADPRLALLQSQEEGPNPTGPVEDLLRIYAQAHALQTSTPASIPALVRRRM